MSNNCNSPQVLPARESKRKLAIKELLETEKHYLERLTCLHKLYKEPAQSVLSQEKHEQLFPSDLTRILELHTNFFSRLQIVDKQDSLEMSIPIRYFVSYFCHYKQYFNKYNAMLQHLQTLRRCKQFSKFLQSVADGNGGHTLESYLIKPIQRVPQYKLLIKEILSHTSQTHKDYANLEQCLADISKANRELNESIRDFDERQKVVEIASRIVDRNTSSLNVFGRLRRSSSSPTSSTGGKLISASRRFVREGSLKRVSRYEHKEYTFVLFNDLLICCAPLRNSKLKVQHAIRLDDDGFAVRKVVQRRILHEYSAFEVHSVALSFIVYASTKEESESWFDSVCEAWEGLHVKQSRGITEVCEEEEEGVEGTRFVMVRSAPMWRPEMAKYKVCMMAACLQESVEELPLCNYCGKLVCDACSQHWLWHFERGAKEANKIVQVCDECYRKYREKMEPGREDRGLVVAERLSRQEALLVSMCCQRLVDMGHTREEADEASRMYSDVDQAVHYLDCNRLLTGQPLKHSSEIERMVAEQYKEVPFDVRVAIDFGTHGTAVKYAVCDNKDKNDFQTYLIDNWTGSNEAKNKTDILLTFDGKFIAFGYDALERYKNGEEYDEDFDSSDTDDDSKDQPTKPSLPNPAQRDMLFESFKMSLYDAELQNIKQEIACTDGRTLPTETVFVNALSHILHKVVESFRYNKIDIKPECIEDMQRIQWTLTVPAIWNDGAKHKMECWAAQAGLICNNVQNQMRIVYEPDCASISWQSEQKESFVQGAKYVLIDAGGGTVDVACHEVVATDQVKEIHHATGGPWGSDFIDSRFEQLLCELFGTDAIQSYKRNYPRDFTSVVNKFRHAKSTFFRNKSCVNLSNLNLNANSKSCSTHSVQLTPCFATCLDPDSIPSSLTKSVRLNCDQLTLAYSVWREKLFDPVILPLVSHITNLLSQLAGSEHRIDCIIICGGLAASRYFQHVIRENFGTHSKHGLSIRIPVKPMLSVIDGALKLAIKPDYIIARRLRLSYVIAANKAVSEVDLTRLPDNYLKTHLRTAASHIPNKHGSIKTMVQTVSGLCSMVAGKNASVHLNEPIEKVYRRQNVRSKKQIISIYSDARYNPYTVQGKPLAELIITFEPEYTSATFKVRFYFGNTTIRVFAMKQQFQLKYQFYSASKHLTIRKPGKPVISRVVRQDKTNTLSIHVSSAGYDDLECNASFQVLFLDEEGRIDESLMRLHKCCSDRYQQSPLVLQNLFFNVKYNIQIKCANEKYASFSDVYQETIVFERVPAMPVIRKALASDGKVSFEFVSINSMESSVCALVKEQASKPETEQKMMRDAAKYFRLTYMIKMFSVVNGRKWINVSVDGCEKEIVDLVNGVQYDFKVCAVTVLGQQSVFTSTVSLTPLKHTSKPTHVMVATTRFAIKVRWMSGDEMESKEVCGSWVVESEPATVRREVSDVKEVMFTVADGLKHGVKYKFWVLAMNEVGCVESKWTQRFQLME